MVVRQKGLAERHQLNCTFGIFCQAAGPSPDQTAQGWPWHPTKLGATARRMVDTGIRKLTYLHLLTTYINLHQLTTSWISWNLLNMPEHLNRHSNHDGLKLQRYDFQAAIVLALPKAREQDSWYCTIHTWKTCLEPCDEHDWDLRPFLGIFDTRHCIHHVIQSAFTEDLLLSVHPSAQTLKG